MLFKNDFSYSSGETGFSIQSVDNTMKLVTSTIQGVRQWSEYRDKIPLVFEIFGKNINYFKVGFFSAVKTLSSV